MTSPMCSLSRGWTVGDWKRYQEAGDGIGLDGDFRPAVIGRSKDLGIGIWSGGTENSFNSSSIDGMEERETQ